MARKMVLAAVPILLIAARAAQGAPPDSTPPSYSMTPSSPSDIYIQGKYDKRGIYIPPHYASKPKPAFHGYFDKSQTTVKHGYFDTPKKHPVDPNDPNATPN